MSEHNSEQADSEDPITDSAETKSTETESSTRSKEESSTDKESSTDARSIQEREHSNVKEAATNQSAPPPSGGGKALGFIAILLSLIALGGSGFTWYQTQVQSVQKETALVAGVSEIGGQINRLSDRISRLQTAQDDVVSEATLEARLSAIRNDSERQLQAMAQSQADMQNAVSQLGDDLAQGTKEFVIDEVAQLLKLANHSLAFSKDLDGGINALQLADAQLKTLGDPRYSRVRQAINEELALLQAVTPVDVESLTGQLRALATTIPDLALENEIPTLGAFEVEADTEETGWRAAAKTVWRDIVALLKPQRIDQAPKPLLAPQQRYFLDQNIQLQLVKAELSVLQVRPAVYLASLNEAERLLQEYYDLDSNAVTGVLSSLESLKQSSLSETLPTVFKSYELLQSVKGDS